MQPYDVLLNSEPNPDLQAYQALLFRVTQDVNRGLERAVFLDIRNGRPAARSAASLHQAWRALVWQHNALVTDLDELITPENWRDYSIVLTPYSWFETREHAEGKQCPRAFAYDPPFIDENELNRWNRWLSRR